MEGTCDGGYGQVGRRGSFGLVRERGLDGRNHYGTKPSRSNIKRPSQPKLSYHRPTSGGDPVSFGSIQWRACPIQ